MTKTELEEILDSLGIVVNEGMTPAKQANTYPRIDYWDYIWDDMMASGEDFAEIETYQISFYSKEPRDKKLLDLRARLRENNLHPRIYHEYVNTDKVFHSYMSIEVGV